MADTQTCEGPKAMVRTSGVPVGSDVRERLRAAQRAEAGAIAAVQRAVAAEASTRARLDQVIVRSQAELSKAAHAVHAAQATLVRTSGLERAAALLDVSSRVLRSAVKDSALDSRVQATSNNTPAATPAPTIAPTET
jgi:hypothetical protein